MRRLGVVMKVNEIARVAGRSWRSHCGGSERMRHEVVGSGDGMEVQVQVRL